MSNSFDSVETTLRSLREIVDRNHCDASTETAELVAQMELLVQEIKAKNKFELKPRQFDAMPTPLGMPNVAPVVV